jgi:hypothetical protein
MVLETLVNQTLPPFDDFRHFKIMLNVDLFSYYSYLNTNFCMYVFFYDQNRHCLVGEIVRKKSGLLEKSHDS